MKNYHFEESLPEKGSKLNLDVEVGEVTIHTHENGRFLTIDADLEQMSIDVSRREGQVFVHVQKADENNEGSPVTRLFKNVNAKAIITIHVPADCELNTRIVAGSLTVDGIAAPVTSRMTAGRTDLRNITGPIYAKTVTGDLGYSGILTAEQHRFETTTGRVRLHLQQTPDAYLDARTVTGSIRCKLPLNELKSSRHLVGEQISGVSGSGKGRIRAQVTTGSISVE